MINKKKRKRELLAQNIHFLDVKIAVLCGASPGELPDFWELYLLENGIRPVFFTGGYNRYYEDALYNDDLLSFAPDIIYIYTTRHNILHWPDIKGSLADAREALAREFSRWVTLWERCRDRFGCLVIQNNFDLPASRTLGSFDGVDPRGKLSFVRALNARVSDYALNHTGFLMQDIAYLCAREGLANWYDPSYMYLYKNAVSVPCTPSLAKSLANMTLAAYGKRKKCIVLDLDNTLWGGLVGEVGYEHVHIGPETPLGEAYLHFQRYIKDIADTGVLLCVASKNDEATAKSGFKARGMVLKEDDFICFYANWEPKSDNIKKMASELNLGLDSFVFIDDNPAERELVKAMLPEVTVLDAAKPDAFILALEASGCFEAVSLSDEDNRRAQMYRENQARQNERSAFESYEDYLKSLAMTCEFSPIHDGNLTRAAQLIEKTNQFNLTARRFTQAEVSAFAGDHACFTLCARLVDKFGDNGIVSVCLADIVDDALVIRAWVMSCRVFSRHLEYAVFDALRSFCAARSIARIVCEYRQTAKNKPCAGFLRELEFACVREDDGAGLWEYAVRHEYANRNAVMHVTWAPQREA